MSDDGAKVIDLAQRRREAKGRRPIMIDANNFRIQATGDGALVIRGECYRGRQWTSFTWTIEPAKAKNLAGQVQAHQNYNAQLAAYAQGLADLRPPQAYLPPQRRKRCKLTPEGWTGGRRGCVRRKDHEGAHRDASGHAYEIREPQKASG